MEVRMVRLTDIDEDLEPRLTRSGFMRATVASVAALSASAAGSLSPSRARAAPPKGPVTRYPLYIPPSASQVGLTLAEAPARVDLGGGQYSNVWAYNGF